MKKLILLLTVFALIFSLAACGKTEGETAEDDGKDGAMGGDMLPGGYYPVLMVNGKLFTWTRLAVRQDFLEYSDGTTDVFYRGDGNTFLPDGYTEVGEISEITDETPTEDLQLMAGFEPTGTVFTSEVTPEVVYVLMTTDWFENYYIRFVSDDLRDNECISYGGKQYRFTLFSETVKELPSECVSVGTLKYIGPDAVPAADLETNCVSDGFGKYLGGREVFMKPDDDSTLYVYEHYYWAQGDYPTWRICKLWEN